MEDTRYKILLIEDDKLDQKAFERSVKDEGLSYDYTIAGSVSEAKSILGSEQFDAVIADYELGDGTSFDILDSAKNSPIIFVTGTGNEEIAVKAWRAGAYDYLTKDADRNYLKAVPITIENAIKQKKAKEEIHRLSHAIEQSPSTVVITDVRGDIEYVNPKFTQMTGYTLEEVKGKNLRILESGEQTPEVHKELWEAITSGREWRGEFHNKKKDSGLYWESASISAITNSEGAITGFLKVAEDITERKKAEEQLRKTEEKYRMQFEGALDAIVVADAETGIIIDCNPAATRLVGREKSELVGQHQRILHPPEEINGEFSRTFKQHLKEKQGQVLETQVITKNGEIKDVAIKASLLEVRGKKIIQGIFRDITEHKQLQEILDRKQKNLEAIFDAAPVGMMIVDEDMIVKRVNDVIRRMVGREYSQIINQRYGGALNCINSTLNEKGCGYSPACAACPFRKTIKSVLDSEECIHELEIHPTLKVDNKEITPWLCISAQPAMIDGCKHVVVAVNDITDRKKAEEKLKEAMEIKSQFISTVSHELRTPLASMKEGIAILLDGVAGEINDEQKNFLNIAKRNVDRLTLLINDVLDFQKLEAGKARANMQENDINEVIGEVQKTMLPSAKKKGIDILLELDDNLPKAKFDRDKIIQVLANLIDNAIKFSAEQGQVSVCVQRQDEELVIRVNDMGMGIPKDALPKIFDRFYRVHRPGQQIQGTGLGLAIVKKIVLMHGGRIEVESEVDQGTTFTVFLPLAAKSIPEVSSAEMDELLENSLVNNQARTK